MAVGLGPFSGIGGLFAPILAIGALNALFGGKKPQQEGRQPGTPIPLQSQVPGESLDLRGINRFNLAAREADPGGVAAITQPRIDPRFAPPGAVAGIGAPFVRQQPAAPEPRPGAGGVSRATPTPVSPQLSFLRSNTQLAGSRALAQAGFIFAPPQAPTRATGRTTGAVGKTPTAPTTIGLTSFEGSQQVDLDTPAGVFLQGIQTIRERNPNANIDAAIESALGIQVNSNFELDVANLIGTLDQRFAVQQRLGLDPGVLLAGILSGIESIAERQSQQRTPAVLDLNIPGINITGGQPLTTEEQAFFGPVLDPNLLNQPFGF